MTAISGHRGAAGILPENTLKGFRHAVSLGLEFTECDVQLSRDGHLVVMHDDTVDRTTNGSGRVADMALDDIRRLDAGDGEQVPTLAEVLEVVHGDTQLLCEMKGPGVEDAAMDAVAAAGMENRVVFTSFHLERIEAVKQRNDRLRTRATFTTLTEDKIARAVDLGACGVDVNYRNVCLRDVEQVLETGMDLVAWNPDDPAGYRAMLALGVPIISTNRPDLLLDYLQANGA